MKDVVQQLRVEVSETVNGRMDTLNCINTALQNVSARSTASLMSDLHLRIQACSDEVETMLVSVESTDKFDNSTLAVDCSDEDFRPIESSLHQNIVQNDSRVSKRGTRS